MKGLLVALGVAGGLIAFSGDASADHRGRGYRGGYYGGGGVRYVSPGYSYYRPSYGYGYGGLPVYSGYRTYVSPGWGYGYPGYGYPGYGYASPGWGYGYPGYGYGYGGGVNLGVYRPGFSLGFTIPIR